MSLHLEVVCGPRVSIDERETQTLRVIGELIPFVLAKYITGSVAAPVIASTNGRAPRDRMAAAGARRRFEI